MMNRYMFPFVLLAALMGGCGTLAPFDPGAPASHHAQRKYDEAVKRGSVVPAVEGKEDRK